MYIEKKLFNPEKGVNDGTTPAQEAWLRATAATVDPSQAIVELGVWQGASLLPLALGAEEGNGSPVFGIDPFGMPEAYQGKPAPVQVRRYIPDNERVARELLGEKATIIRGLGAEVGKHWEGPKVGLWHHDAQHSYDALYEDFEAWKPHLAPGAWIGIDDVDVFPGLTKAVKELFRGYEKIGPRFAVYQMPS